MDFLTDISSFIGDFIHCFGVCFGALVFEYCRPFFLLVIAIWLFGGETKKEESDPYYTHYETV